MFSICTDIPPQKSISIDLHHHIRKRSLDFEKDLRPINPKLCEPTTNQKNWDPRQMPRFPPFVSTTAQVCFVPQSVCAYYKMQ